MAIDLTDKQRSDVKKQVLESRVYFLGESLSRFDVDKYVIAPEVKEGVLDSTDREVIDNKVTTHSKVEAIVDILKTRRGRRNEHGLDVLINVLNEGMHSEVAQALQRARHRAMARERAQLSPAPNRP